MTINSLFAFLALMVYLATLVPSNLAKVFPHTKRWKFNRYLLKQRRLLGLTAFSLSLDHVIISVTEKQINLLSLETYKTYYTGFSVLTIFTILAFTSNNWSIRKLKQKWKLLHQLTYVALVLLVCHFGFMNDTWTILTPVGLSLMSLVFFLYVTRLIVTGVKIINYTEENSSSVKASKTIP